MEAKQNSQKGNNSAKEQNDHSDPGHNNPSWTAGIFLSYEKYKHMVTSTYIISLLQPNTELAPASVSHFCNLVTFSLSLFLTI